MSASAQAPVPVSAAIPALFVSHGAPLFALDAGTTGPALTQWGQSLKSQYPGLRGVVIMSPHWMARSAQVMTGPQPATLKYRSAQKRIPNGSSHARAIHSPNSLVWP